MNFISLTPNDAKKLGKVAVLMGGTSAEREISLLSGNGVLAALKCGGIDAHAFDPAERPMDDLKREGFARCFIALHGRHGEDGCDPGRARADGHPVHRPGPDGVGHRDGQGHDQARLARRGAADAARPRAGPRRAGRQVHLPRCPTSSGLPLIVKPPHEGSSVGVTKVRSWSQMKEAVELAAGYDVDVLCEEFIDGDEVTVALRRRGHGHDGAAGGAHRRARRQVRPAEQVLHRRREVPLPERPARGRGKGRAAPGRRGLSRARLPRLEPRRPDHPRAPTASPS